MSDNPFECIAEMRENQVKECDKAGYADKFKTCTELFFKEVNEILRECPVNFEDVQFLDGYFIFGTGTNSVVQFHIRECREWLFGIWWKMPKDSSQEQSFIEGEVFAQYEEEIDKFKPSRSKFCSSIEINPEEGREGGVCYTATKMIRFIRDDPYLAFCRDYCGWDYNEEYHTREEAKSEYDRYCVWRCNKARYTKECDAKVISFIQNRVLPFFTDAEIVDRGEDWSPRYDVIAPYEKNKDIVEECGIYTWFEEDDEDGVAIMSEYDELVKECKKVSDEYNFYWLQPFNPVITFYSNI